MLVLGILSSTTTLTSYNNIGSSLPNEGDCIHIVTYISAAHNQSSQTGCNTTEIKPLPQMNHPKHPFTLDSGPEKKGILLWTQFYGKGWGIEFGGNIFHSLHCPQRQCIVTHNRSAILQADAVLFNLRDMPAENDLPNERTNQQKWVLLDLESPYHSQVDLAGLNGLFNMTSTYSQQSDLPAIYGAFRPFASVNMSEWSTTKPLGVNYMAGKTRLVAWFVTNCKAANHRLEYVKSLQRHIQVDIYGACGKLRCKNESRCWTMLATHYKFYLAFENSNCDDYITEKLWYNALQHNVVPVVMGAPRVDYEKYAPPRSLIHVDNFSSTHDLARFIRTVGHDARLYNEYFRWKQYGLAQSFINLGLQNSPMWCDLCSTLHDQTLARKTHRQLEKWWSRKRQCRTLM
jgi:glycoprotein 3-alpha-L-fucosyltransferase